MKYSILKKVFPGGLNSRLSLRLVFYVVVCSLFFTFITSAFQLYIAYQNDVEKIHENLQFIEESYLPFIEKAAYDVDERQLELQLQGLLQLQDFEYLEINKVATGIEVTVGNQDAKRDFVGVLKLKYQISNDIEIDMGVLTVVASYQGIYQRLRDRIAVILLVTMIQVFTVALFTLLIIQYLIVRHLSKMADYAETLNTDTLDTVLTLNRKKSRPKKADELDQLVNSFNNLQTRIKKDIVDLNVVEAALRENEKKLFAEKQFSDTLISTLPVMFYLYEEGERLIRWNKVHETATGYSSEELLGKQPMDFFDGQDEEDQVTTLQQVLNGDSETISGRLKTKNGDSIPYLFSSSALIQNGKTYLLGTGVDISALKSAEKELYLTKYSIDNSSIAAYWIKENGRVHYANKAAGLISGYSVDDLYDFPIGEILPYFNEEEFQDRWCEIKELQTLSFETIQKDRYGEDIPVEINISFQEFEGEEFIFAYIQDISERKRAETEKTRLVSVIEQSNDNIVITDLKGNIDYSNPAFEQVTGYSKNEVYQKNPRILKSGKHDKQFYNEIWNTISEGKVWSGNIINRRKDGRLFQESATIFPITDSKGVITNYAAVKRDITEQIRLEEQLQQTQKLEAIGTLAGGIAHDFNNILGAIYGYTRLAQKKLPKSPEHERISTYLKKIHSAGSRAEGLVSQILTFSRKAEFEPETINVEPLLKEAIKFLQASLPSSIKIRFQIDSKLNNVFGDYTQIHQIIMNLCTNSSHAMEENGGELNINLNNFEIISHSPETCNLDPGSYVLLQIQDTGVGMEEEVYKRIFEPFFTTKEKGKGTGLGLSVVHGIVEKHNGGIQVYSRLGIGTKISVYLPVSDIVSIHPPQQSDKELPLGTESILLVDDETDIANSYGEMLKMQGYNVRIHTDSGRALREISENHESFNLVITDYNMPGMDGIKLSKEILKLAPGTPIIIVSGLGELISNQEIESSGIAKRMSKPVEFEELVISVRSIIDEFKIAQLNSTDVVDESSPSV